MIAVILAGGMGKRLRPITENIPKAMVEVNGKPILEHQIELFKRHGVKKIYLCTGYKHEVVENYFGDGSLLGVKIIYSKEDKPLGTGGALKKLKNIVKEPFILMNCDMLTDLDFSELFRRHIENGRMVTTVGVNPISPWGILNIGDGLVKNFVEKPRLPQWINSGIHVINPDIFDYLPEEGSLEREVLPILAEKSEIAVFEHDGFWKAVETEKDLEEMNIFIQEMEKDMPW